MEAIERIPSVTVERKRNWPAYLFDICIGAVGSLIISSLIYQARLYPLIADIILVYLPWIVVLAIMRSRVAAVSASIFAFISFNLFLIPPFFTFQMAKRTDWIALLVFLFTAIVTGQLTGMLRRKNEELRASERRFHIFYELLRVYHSTNKFDEQMDIIALSTMRVFASFGLCTCAVLLPDQHRRLRVEGDAPIQVDAFEPTPAMLEAAQIVLHEGKPQIIPAHSPDTGEIYIIPLRSDNKTAGVLLLHSEQEISWLKDEGSFKRALADNEDQTEFFWTYIEQVSALVEHSVFVARQSLQENI